VPFQKSATSLRVTFRGWEMLPHNTPGAFDSFLVIDYPTPIPHLFTPRPAASAKS